MIGVTVGKFNPPHLGHLHLIETAAGQVDRLVVIVGDRKNETIPASDRAEWIAADSPPNVEVLTTTDDLPEAPAPWAARTLELLGTRPAIAFTSERYGQAWAEAMGCRHAAVDPTRSTFPISATDLRADLTKHFGWLVPSARAALSRRVTVVGAESTGKSTMAEALAMHYGTVWIPEYGRWYWEGRRHLTDQRWTGEEFVRIAKAQIRLEADLARKAEAGVLIADTDALVTSVWHRRYLGHDHPELTALARVTAPDLYLVCAPDFPWHQDGTRESRAQRDTMHTDTLTAVDASSAARLTLSGAHDDRLATAIDRVDDLRRFGQLT